MIPDPWVMDGMEARLDLIECSWRKDKPTDPDMKTVSLLRSILSRIGHMSRDPEPDRGTEPLQHEPSKSSLMQTLTHMETEASALMALTAENGGKSTETAVRGDEDYCSYRTTMIWEGHSQLQYPMPSPGRECECVTPHEYQREPRSWALTPAEAEFDHNEPRDEKVKKGKSVRFVAPVVTQVQYFVPWWCDEYRDSDRYWSQGRIRRSRDLSTSVDDDWEILRLEDPEAFAVKKARELEEARSEGFTIVEDESMLNEMDEAGDSLDDEMVDEMVRLDDEETDDWEESEEDFF